MAKRAFDEGRIFGVTHGPPPYRVLALPGWLHTTADWDAVLPPLGVGAIALDLPGFGGATPEPDAAMGSPGYADRVAPVLGELAPAPVVVGHSFGGRVALHLAARHPGRIGALVLTGVPNLVRSEARAAKAPLAFRLARALNRRGMIVSDDRMEALRRRHGSHDYRTAPSRTMRDVLVAVTNEDYEEQLRATSCPVELVYGEHDTAAPPAVARRAADVLGPRSTLTVLPGVDHFTPTHAPEALTAAIARHL